MGYLVPVGQGGGEPLLGVDSRRRQQVLWLRRSRLAACSRAATSA
jgi:hypothetical protein